MKLYKNLANVAGIVKEKCYFHMNMNEVVLVVVTT